MIDIIYNSKSEQIGLKRGHPQATMPNRVLLVIIRLKFENREYQELLLLQIPDLMSVVIVG